MLKAAAVGKDSNKCGFVSLRVKNEESGRKFIGN
jgi:hypothetical protein